MKRFLKKNALNIPFTVLIIILAFTMLGLAGNEDYKDAKALEEQTVKVKENIKEKASAEPKEKPKEDKLLGTFTVTAYCPCKICCGKWSNPNNPVTASGEPAVEGVTVGASWDVIQSGTSIKIEGIGKRIVQDKPAEWIVDKYNGKILDLYFKSHDEALKFGKQELKVWEE